MSIKVVEPGSTYKLSIYTIDESGLKEIDELDIKFLKGIKGNVRQQGIITVDVLSLALDYLETVNVGDLRTRETSLAITKIEEAMMWLKKRRDDREKRGVLNTYKK